MTDSAGQLGYTSYQARTTWYMQNFAGVPKEIHPSLMEDGSTKIAVMEFAPHENRPFWTYATNGMSERRMPCINEPHGDPRVRLEVLGYAAERADWVIELLQSMAVYPFQHKSGLAIGHTLPVSAPQPRLWDGYLLTAPIPEPEEFNPMAIDIGLKEDWVFFAQVIGLIEPELQFAIEHGGPPFEKRIRKGCTASQLRSVCMLDQKRTSLI